MDARSYLRHRFYRGLFENRPSRGALVETVQTRVEKAWTKWNQAGMFS
jgi:hypothetical protein